MKFTLQSQQIGQLSFSRRVLEKFSHLKAIFCEDGCRPEDTSNFFQNLRSKLPEIQEGLDKLRRVLN